MRISTELWQEKDIEQWKMNYKRIVNAFAIIFILNTAYLAGQTKDTTTMGILIANILILVFIIVINISYKRYTKNG